MDTELIADICNKLQAPYTALEMLSKGEDVPDEFIKTALKSLEEAKALLSEK